MDLQQILRQAAQESGNSNLAINPGEACEIEMENGEKIVYELSEDGRRLYIYAVILDDLPEKREEIYEKALSLNLFAKETIGATIAFDDSRDELLLFLFKDEDDSQFDLLNITNNLLNALINCKKKLSETTTEKNDYPSSNDEINLIKA